MVRLVASESLLLRATSPNRQADVVMEMEMAAAGHRSFAIGSRLVHSGTGDVLMQHRCSCVCTGIDEDTGKRKSVPLPTWFLEGLPYVKVNGGGPSEAWPRRLEPWIASGRGIRVWIGRVTVRPSDTDGNGHVNNACYVTMAEDAAADAAKAGSLPGFTEGDTAGLKLLSVQVQYEREAFWGDELEVRLIGLCGGGGGSSSSTGDDATRPVAFEIYRPSSDDLLLVLGVLTYAPVKIKANKAQARL